MIKKKMGQVFLKDKNIINNFINYINPLKNDYFIEIGSGNGSLTKNIIQLVKNIILIELDFKLYNILLKKFLNNKNVFIFKQDARFLNLYQFNFNKNYIKYRIFGSLPYCSSIPIIMNLCKYIDKIKDVYFMVQKEVSDRLISNHGNSNYCKLSIIIKLFFDVYLIHDKINPKFFNPVPKVYSSIIKMIPKKNNKLYLNENEFKNFKKVIKHAFEHKRKIIKNSLSKLFTINQLKIIKNINIFSRAQDISIYQYYLLSKLL